MGPATLLRSCSITSTSLPTVCNRRQLVWTPWPRAIQSISNCGSRSRRRDAGTGSSSHPPFPPREVGPSRDRLTAERSPSPGKTLSPSPAMVFTVSGHSDNQFGGAAIICARCFRLLCSSTSLLLTRTSDGLACGGPGWHRPVFIPVFNTVGWAGSPLPAAARRGLPTLPSHPTAKRYKVHLLDRKGPSRA